jgi:hypothetical protein
MFSSSSRVTVSGAGRSSAAISCWCDPQQMSFTAIEFSFDRSHDVSDLICPMSACAKSHSFYPLHCEPTAACAAKFNLQNAPGRGISLGTPEL